MVSRAGTYLLRECCEQVLQNPETPENVYVIVCTFVEREFIAL